MIFTFLILAKVRRLYDIANILTSLGLIKKKVFVGPLHIKKPGYSWSGPTIEEIESACKCGQFLVVLKLLFINRE